MINCTFSLHTIKLDALIKVNLMVQEANNTLKLLLSPTQPAALYDFEKQKCFHEVDTALEMFSSLAHGFFASYLTDWGN